MPIYNASLLHIDVQETRRYAGLMKAKDFDDQLIEDACTEALLLAQPRGIWSSYAYDGQTQTVQDQTPFLLQGAKIGAHLAGADKVILLAATVGDAIEAAVTKHFQEGRYAYSVLLDAAATAAVEQIADAMEKTIRPQAARAGYTMRWRFSPGYGDWPLDQQPDLIRLSQAEKIGITLSSALMLVPRKSITAIIGLVRTTLADCKQSQPAGSCSDCDKLDCPSRKLPPDPQK